MYDWPLNDAHLVLLVLVCVALITSVIVLTRVRRAEFARLQNEVKQLSVSVKALEAAEQRRFIVELKSSSAGAEPAIAASATKVVAISESDPSRQLADHGGQQAEKPNKKPKANNRRTVAKEFNTSDG